MSADLLNRCHVGDCREVLRDWPEAFVDAVVTDPPYHLIANKKDDQHRASPDAAQRNRGFMGMKWDGGDVAFQPDTWSAISRAMKPGAYLVAFGGTRTFHRLMCAIEDAGLELRDTLMWVYGSGFPKGTDKAKIPAEWKGWNTALKPAWEPIVLARKPLAGTLAANLQAHGCGAMNIDGSRIPVADAAYAANCSGDRGHDDNRARAMDFGMTAGSASALGRWPANLIHDGSDEVVSLFPTDAGAQAPVHVRHGDKFRNSFGAFAGNIDEAGSTFHADAGSAARFFYCAKASREDRNEGLEGREERPLLWSSGTKNPGAFQSANTRRAAENNHPTVKPTALMRWLTRLVTPPGGVVLDPFCGSGSTLKAARIEGYQYVGIELDPSYAEIAEARTAAVQPGLVLA